VPRPPLRMLVLGRRAFSHCVQRLIPARLMDWLVARSLGFDKIRERLSSRA
jgi:hypothetical protein